ncbi:hypothetical protein LTR64_000638 [Lithohypha guttulata]|uniref:uncharacterized protein n=1 Tax=Lithohypha guttulata TaxID=1690604 RepID=UPI002DE1297D|nr:hypothetical protein LTR51_005594 [Lithohypha guttulata]
MYDTNPKGFRDMRAQKRLANSTQKRGILNIWCPVRHFRRGGKQRRNQSHDANCVQYGMKAYWADMQDIQEADWTQPDKLGFIEGDPELCDTVYWDCGFDGHNILLYGEHDPEGEVEVQAILAGRLDTSPAYTLRHIWEEEDAPSFSGSGFWDAFEHSLGSSGVVVRDDDAQSTMSDFDKMSDFPGAFPDQG